MIEMCPFCELDTAGNHRHGCPNYKWQNFYGAGKPIDFAAELNMTGEECRIRGIKIAKLKAENEQLQAACAADVMTIKQILNILEDACDMMRNHSISAMVQWCDTRGKRAIDYIKQALSTTTDYHNPDRLTGKNGLREVSSYNQETDYIAGDKEIRQRLAEYEDTGLTPKQVGDLQAEFQKYKQEYFECPAICPKYRKEIKNG